jgi:hypothetical protein
MTNVTNLSTSRPLPDSWTKALHEKMMLNFGKKFTDQWDGVNPARMAVHWSEQLAGYTGPELSRGVAEMDLRDWPPTLPEFKRMCRPTLDLANSYYEAVAGVAARASGKMGAWSHPAVYWAAVPLAYDLGNQTYGAMKGRWDRALSSEMDKGEWEPIPVPMIALPAPGKSRASAESSAEMLKQLDARGITKKSGDRVNHLAWAQKIIERIRTGDKTVSMIQQQFAKEALELS